MDRLIECLGNAAIDIGVLAFLIAAAPVYVLGYVACQMGLVE